jgi:beta-glucanase (GH16 family)
MPDPKAMTICCVVAAALLVAVPERGGASTVPSGPKGQFELVFSDDFNGNTLDLQRWTTCYWWVKDGCTNLGNNELEWYMPQNVSVADGKLLLTARREDVVGWEGRIFPYTSGMVTTGRYYEEDPSAVRFDAVRGIFEMRAKVPSGQGLWPAFWMLPSSRESKPEIDIMELLGHRPEQLELHFHYRNDAGDSRNVGHKVRTSDLSAGWNTDGVEWSAQQIVWYLDGVEVWRYGDRQRIPDEPMYMLLNLAVGGDWPGAPDATTKFPAVMEVDYVRAWKRTR